MSAVLPLGNQCITPSPCSPVVVSIPGPPGAPGQPGSNGQQGVSAFTVTTAAFTMPAELANVTVSVGNSTWAGVGENLFVVGAGTFQVISAPDGVTLTLKNLKSTGTNAYLSNVAPGTNVGSNSIVTPTGLQGVNGATAVDANLMFGNVPPVAPPPDVTRLAIWRDQVGLATYYWNPTAAAWV